MAHAGIPSDRPKSRNPFRRLNWLNETGNQELKRRITSLEATVTEFKLTINALDHRIALHEARHMDEENTRVLPAATRREILP